MAPEQENKLSWLIGIPRGEYGAMALEVPAAHYFTTQGVITPGCRLAILEYDCSHLLVE
jgi:hypothetical protein